MVGTEVLDKSHVQPAQSALALKHQSGGGVGLEGADAREINFNIVNRFEEEGLQKKEGRWLVEDLRLGLVPPSLELQQLGHVVVEVSEPPAQRDTRSSEIVVVDGRHLHWRRFPSQLGGFSPSSSSTLSALSW